MVKPLRFIHALRVATISRAARESRSRECWAGSVGGEKARTGKLSRVEENTRDEENRGPASPRKQPLDLIVSYICIHSIKRETAELCIGLL